MSTNILILGAGKSATFLIEYLQQKAVENNWYILLVDGDEKVAIKKWNNAPNGHAIGIDIKDTTKRHDLISSSTVVISMLPAFLHSLVAEDCLLLGKSLFTASYVEEGMKKIQNQIQEKGLLFLCEMGLDPGIDHMSAMELIHRIQKQGGKITSFASHCGGLIAPESDNNPWHYKISWNPRNIILTGKSGAIYLENGKKVSIPYSQLFQGYPIINIEGIAPLTYYPNRNSLDYIQTYSLVGIQNFVRTTLRSVDFCAGWNAIVQLKLTDETSFQLQENTTIQQWFRNHLTVHSLEEKYDHLIQDPTLFSLLHYLDLNSNQLIQVHFNNTKHSSPSNYTTNNASILQWILEDKWKLAPSDKDMIVMQHQIEYVFQNQTHFIESSLILKGKDATHTAMSCTVGLPLAISVCAYLKGEITCTGLHIPTLPEIYEPVLKVLKEEGIVFTETHHVQSH
jgi:saccharopine dehydrogenase (NADP+, L-glutamate forming)